MEDADWDEEKYLRKLRTCVIQAVAENRNNPVSMTEIIHLFKEHNEMVPNVKRFGFDSIDAFFKKYNDKFVSINNEWMYAPNSLTDNEKKNMINIELSQKSNNRPARRGGSVPSGGGRGGGFAGGSAGRGGGFGGTGGFNNFDTRPAHNTGNLFAENTQYKNFNNQRFNYPTPDRNRESPNDYNQRYNDGYGSFSGKRDNYHQNRVYDDKREGHGNRRDNDNYGFNHGYEEQNGFIDRQNDHRNVYDLTPSFHHNQPEPELSTPPFGGISQPVPLVIPEYPPGLEPTSSKTVRLSPTPGLAGPSNVLATTTTTNAGASTPGTTADTTTAAGPPGREFSYSEMAKAFLRHLHSIWPKKMDKTEMLQVFEVHPTFNRIISIDVAEREYHLDKMQRKLAKPLYAQFYHKETAGVRVYYTFRAGHPPGETVQDQAAVGMTMVGNFLKERPQDNSTTKIADVLGIETREGVPSGWFVLEYVRHRTSEFKTQKVSGSNYVVTVLPGAILERWMPELPKELEAWKDPDAQVELQEAEPEPENLFDNLRLLEAAQALVAEMALEEDNYTCDHEPLSTIFEKDAYNGPDSFPVRVSFFGDLNRFYIQREDDYEEYKRLKMDMTGYYMTQDVEPMRHIVEGQKVVFWRQRGNEEAYLRGTVAEVERKAVKIHIMDEAGFIRVPRDDIFALDEYYSELPALATRCSIGDFVVSDDYTDHQFDLQETKFAEDVASCQHIDAKIHRVEKSILVVDLRLEMANNKVIEAPLCFKNMVHFLD